MRNKKTRYRRIKERFLVGASGGLMAGMIFIGSASTVLAEGTDLRASSYSQSITSDMHVMHKWKSKSRINALASNLGLDQDYIDQELKSGKTLKQILQENGVDTAKLNKAFNKKGNKSWKKNSLGV